MKNLVFSAIAGITSFFRSLRLKQSVITVLAGFLLLANTACGSASNAASPRSYDYNAAPDKQRMNERTSTTTSPYNQTSGLQRELYKATQRQQGGMNNYNDDPAYNNSKDINAKAQALIEQAESRLQNRAETPQAILENALENNPLGQGAKDISRRFEDSAEQAREQLTEGTQQGFRNLRTSIDHARQEAPGVMENVKQNALDATEDVRSGAEDLVKSAQKAAERAANEAQYRAQNAANAMGDRS